MPYIVPNNDEDPSVKNAVKKGEDLTNPMDISGGLDKTEGKTNYLNNNFCFTPKAFIETCNSVNDDTHHQVTYTAAWKTIYAILGHEETCTNRNDGSIVLKVISSHSVVQDDFKEIREKRKIRG